jgi:iron complex transport system ATP-binding protein
MRERDQAFSILSVHGLTVSVHDRVLVRDLDVQFAPGSITAILGTNGAGKTLTLHTLARLRAPAAGEVRLDQRSIEAWPRREFARTLGLLPQFDEDAFPSSALEAALVGRHPHIGFWDWESNEDRQIASAALSAVDLQGFEEREVATLSGGERRRVALAALLTQAPQIYLLDEPINHLDPHHQTDILRLLREQASQGHTVIMSLHDAALAARFADHALLLFGDGRWQSGPADTILSEHTLSALYALPVREVRWPGGRTFVMG